MDAKKLGTSLFILGIVLLIAAVFWWMSFYSPIVEQLHTDLKHASSCLYSNDGVCAIATGLSQFAGKSAYSPVVLWLGALLTVVGGLMRVSAK